MELLGAEASSHRTLMDLLMFCFYAERNGKPMKAQLVSFVPKKKKCFRCYAENSFVVGKREKLEVGSPFRKWFLQFRNQGVPAGGGDADEGISGEDAEMQTDRNHTE